MFRNVIVVLLGYFIGCNALLSRLEVPDETLLAVKPKKPQSKAQGVECSLIILDYAQGSFNRQVGLPSEMNWLNGTEMSIEVDKLLMTSVDELLTICRAHQLFVHYAGAYDVCLDQWYLLSHTDITVQNAFDYVHLFSKLDFVCNSGFEEVANQWACLHPVQSTTEYQTCASAFKDILDKEPAKLCSGVNTFMKCAQKVAYNSCNKSKSAGWWTCEETRVGFAKECRELRCYVEDIV